MAVNCSAQLRPDAESRFGAPVLEGAGLTPGRTQHRRSPNQQAADRRGQRCAPGLRLDPHWTIADLASLYYLDILAKEAGMEAEPVGGDIEPSLEKEVPLESAGAHWEVAGEKTAMSEVSQEAPVQSPASETVLLRPPRPKRPVPSAPRVLTATTPCPLTARCFLSSIHAPKGLDRLLPQCPEPGFSLPQGKSLALPALPAERTPTGSGRGLSRKQ